MITCYSKFLVNLRKYYTLLKKIEYRPEERGKYKVAYNQNPATMSLSNFPFINKWQSVNGIELFEPGKWVFLFITAFWLLLLP